MNLERWEQALEAATAIRDIKPEPPEGWIYCASTLVTLGRNQKAVQVLEEAVKAFPDDEIINYDLASVCCLLGRTEEARKWLSRAVELGGDEVKLKALDDPDLGPVWRSENE
jgi:predicted Zn-dependent protease